MPLGKAIYTSFTGISPAVAEEICYLAGLESGITAGDLSGDMMAHLFRQFALLYGRCPPRRFPSGHLL